MPVANKASGVNKVVKNRWRSPDKPLTDKEASFVEAYLMIGEGAKAVEKSLYNCTSPMATKRLAWELLRKPHIKAAVDAGMEGQKEATGLDEGYVVNKIMATIIKAENAAKPDFNAILRGCELLARTLGMLRDRQEITGKDGGPIETQEVEEQSAAFLSAISRLTERAKD